MAVPDLRHVVVGVEERATRRIDQPGPVRANHVQRPIVEEAESRPEPLHASREQLLEIVFLRPERLFGNPEDRIGIGGEVAPDGPLVRCADAGKGSGNLERIREDLEMNRSAARRNPADRVALPDRISGLKAVRRILGETAIAGVEADPVPNIVLEDQIPEALPRFRIPLRFRRLLRFRRPFRFYRGELVDDSCEWCADRSTARRK
jgi:hypothetical protein